MLHANPSGILQPEAVVGRDELVKRLWRVLDRQSLVLTGERRMGKTSLVKKMMALTPTGTLAYYADLEGVRSPLEFVLVVVRQAERDLGEGEQILRRTTAWLQRILPNVKLGPVTIFPIEAELHWKELLTTLFEDLGEQQKQRTVFFWDEVPLMLFNIKQGVGDASGEQVAMELLDTLRAIRQRFERVRMVFTGSIGLHLVLSTLRRAGHANDATNDMYIEEVLPLSPLDAQNLALALFQGENLAVAEPIETAKTLAAAVDYVPFFIHHIIDDWTLRTGPLSPPAVEASVANALLNSQDAWHLLHYHDRLKLYYEPQAQPLALGLLDTLAMQPDLSLDELQQLLRVNAATAHASRETVLELLTLLQHDHYLQRDAAGRYRFRFSLIARFWREHRGLA